VVPAWRMMVRKFAAQDFEHGPRRRAWPNAGQSPTREALPIPTAVAPSASCFEKCPCRARTPPIHNHRNLSRPRPSITSGQGLFDCGAKSLLFGAPAVIRDHQAVHAVLDREAGASFAREQCLFRKQFDSHRIRAIAFT